VFKTLYLSDQHQHNKQRIQQRQTFKRSQCDCNI